MPTNPVSPNTGAAVDRLTLGVESARGAEPAATMCAGCSCVCFDTESSGFGTCSMCACGCFEAEPSSQTPTGVGCFCAEGA